jgi:hypothetical protein
MANKSAEWTGTPRLHNQPCSHERSHKRGALQKRAHPDTATKNPAEGAPSRSRL